MAGGTVTYVVAVHGMGEPKRNETAARVISAMERAQRQLDPARRGRASRAAHPAAAERAGVPWSPYSAWGENVRFADFWWSDVTRAGFGDVGQTTELWGGTVLDRLEGMSSADDPRGPTSPASVAVVVVMSLNAIKVLRLGAALASVLTQQDLQLPRQAFDSTLGDVQVYAENETVRLCSLWRLDRFLRDLVSAHTAAEAARANEAGDTPRPCRIVLAAHSLGSVLALESIVRASVAGGLRPLPGTAARSDSPWIDKVDALVTFGSPIDKFLRIWPESFAYLDGDRWEDASGAWLRRPRPVEHYHLTDALDVIADEGGDVSATAAHRRIFRFHPLTFPSGGLPVHAHVMYWARERLAYALIDAIRGVGPAYSASLARAAASAKHVQRIAFNVIAYIPLALALLVAAMVGVVVVMDGVWTVLAATAAAVLGGAAARCFIDATAWAEARLTRSERGSWSPIRWWMTFVHVLLATIAARAWISFAGRGGLPLDVERTATIVLTAAISVLVLRRWGWLRTTLPTWSLVPASRWLLHLAVPLALGVVLGFQVGGLKDLVRRLVDAIAHGPSGPAVPVPTADGPRELLQMAPFTIYVLAVVVTALSATLFYVRAQRLVVAELMGPAPAPAPAPAGASASPEDGAAS